MRKLQVLGLLSILAIFATSCANKRGSAKVGSNPYSSNPYYTGSDSVDSGSATPSSGSAQYPSYDDSAAYTPPAPTTPSYPDYSGANNTGGTYSSPAPSGGTYPGYSSSSNNSGYGYSNSGGKTHTVAKGENLYRISLQYATTVGAIQSANGLGNSNTIHPGQVLVIP